MHTRMARCTPLSVLVSLSLALLGGCAEAPAGVEARMSPAVAPAETVQRAVIYGDDNRVDYYAHDNEILRGLTDNAIVAVMSTDEVVLEGPDDADADIYIEPYGPSHGLCTSEPFYNQPSVASCSATLIGEDLVLTARHCVDGGACPYQYYVFNYYYAAEGQLAPIGATEVYSCKEVAMISALPELDAAIVRLDRKVVGRTPAKVNLASDGLNMDQQLWMIGFPSGLPAKIADGGRVREPGVGQPPYEMKGSVDAFGGNSGSGVFDTEGEVVGVLSGGLDDWEETSEGCLVSNVVPEDAEGERIIYAGRIVERYCGSEQASDDLCPIGQGTWCRTCTDASVCAEGFVCGGEEAETGLRRCTQACKVAADCRDDHFCLDGLCAARWLTYCDGNDAVYRESACGADGGLGEACENVEYCAAGVCEERAPGDLCATAFEVAVEDQTLTGAWSDAVRPDYRSDCRGRGPDVAYLIQLEEGARLTATLAGSDTVLHLRDASCARASEIACNDDHDDVSGHGSKLSELLPAGSYYLIVDTYSSEDAHGTYQLKLQFDLECAATCDAGDKQCDGNGVQVCAMDGEGCTTWRDDVTCAAGAVCRDGACVEALPGDSCDAAIELELDTQTLTVDVNVGVSSTVQGSCGGEGRELIYAFNPQHPYRVVATATGLDTVLHVRRSDCADEALETECNDDADGVDAGGSRVDVLMHPPGPYFLAVDTFDDQDVGPINLVLDVRCAPECEPGVGRCWSGGVESCELGPEGCGRWAPAPDCRVEETCVSGTCVPQETVDLTPPPEPEPDPTGDDNQTVDGKASDDGCAAGGTRSPLPLAGLGLMLWLLAAPLRRRIGPL